MYQSTVVTRTAYKLQISAGHIHDDGLSCAVPSAVGWEKINVSNCQHWLVISDNLG